MRHPIRTDTLTPTAEPASIEAAGPSDPQSAELAAEERSEDAHGRAEKVSDPVRWAQSAARRSAQARGPVRRRALLGRTY
jgi:hypothetical protein